MKSVRLFSIVLLFIFLVSCHLIPSTVVPRLGGGNTLQGTVQVQPVSQSAPSLTPGLEMVTVHQESRAIRSPLQEPTAEVIAQLSGGAGLFVSRQATGHGIQMPDVGAFEILFRQGTQYRVIDGDARDGKAVVELPEGTYHFGLQAGEGWSARSALTFVDDLYYLRDTLRQSRHPWLASQRLVSLGVKPLPVPESWHGRAGRDVVLGFEAEDVESFRLVWKTQEGVAPYPPGVGKIGVAGGRLSLPGVGEIEIPEGALEKDEVVAIEEVLDFDVLEYLTKELSFLSAYVKLHPYGLAIKKPIKVRTVIDAKLLGRTPRELASSNYKPTTCEMPISICWEKLYLEDLQQPVTLDSWSLMPEFTAFLVTISNFLRDREIQILSQSNFSTQQAVNPHSRFQVMNTTARSEVTKYSTLIDEALTRAYDVYQSHFSTKPKPAIDPEMIPLYISDTEPNGEELAEATITNYGELYFDRWSIYIPAGRATRLSEGADFAQTAMHELLHVFQNTQFAYVTQMQDAGRVYDDLDKSWFLESSARYMGYALLNEKFRDLAQYETFAHPASLSAKARLDLIYGTRFGVDVTTGLAENRMRSLSKPPYLPEDLSPLDKEAYLPNARYYYAHYVSVLAQLMGMDGLLNMNNSYAAHVHDGTLGVVKQINQNMPLDKSLLAMAEGLLFREYGIGDLGGRNKRSQDLTDAFGVLAINRQRTDPIPAEHKVEYGLEHTQFNPVSLIQSPHEPTSMLAPLSMYYYQIGANAEMVKDVDNLSEPDKDLVIYFEEDPNHLMADEVENMRVFLTEFKSTTQHHQPVVTNPGGEKFRRSTWLSCDPALKQEKYMLHVANFVARYDNAIVVAVNAHYPSEKSIKLSPKAYVPTPELCQMLQSDRGLELEGLYLEDVKSVRLDTNAGERFTSVKASEVGDRLTVELPAGVEEVYSVSGVTCEGKELTAYIEEKGYGIASEGGPSCECSCSETNTLSVVPELVGLWAHPDDRQKLMGESKYCQESQCEMLFDTGSRGLLKSPVKIVSTDAEGLQRFEVLVPNHVPPGSQVLLSSLGYTSEARYMPSVCQVLPVDYRIQASGACT